MPGSIAGLFVFYYQIKQMRKIEAQTIQAVRDLLWMAEFSGCYWHSGNMEVSQSHHGISGKLGYERIISVRLHGNEIFALRPDCQHIWFSDCGWQTATTKSRLNVLLKCFSRGFGLYQKKGEWFVTGYGLQDEKWKGFDSVPFCLDAENWMLQRAEELAASKLEKRTGMNRDRSSYI